MEPGRIAIVPGLCCDHDGVPDVMRGEETQVFGALELLGMDHGLFVLPGTHSKWVRVAGGRIESFATFMTGEFYALLRKHSILARTLPDSDGEFDRQAFERGVAPCRGAAAICCIPHSARARSRCSTIAAGGTAELSLRPGHRRRAALASCASFRGPVVVIGSATLTPRYELALDAGRARTVRRLRGDLARPVGLSKSLEGAL